MFKFDIDRQHIILICLITVDISTGILGFSLRHWSELFAVTIIVTSIKSAAQTTVAFYTKAPEKKEDKNE